LARVIGSFSATKTGGSAMTHSNFSTLLRRASERFVSGVGAIALTACLLAVSDARASAAEFVDVGPSVTVTYAHDAFTSEQGTAQVYRKLKRAARSVCGFDDGNRLTLQTQRFKDQCYAETLARAVNKVDRPLLSALHQATAPRQVS
jgi:UrcA family protein